MFVYDNLHFNSSMSNFYTVKYVQYVYSVCVDTDQLRLEQLELLFLTVSVNIQIVIVFRLRYSIKILVIYSLQSDNYLVIWVFDGLGLQHLIISIFGSRIFKDKLDLLCSGVHVFKSIIWYSGWKRFSFRWCMTENFSLEVLKFFFLIFGSLLWLRIHDRVMYMLPPGRLVPEIGIGILKETQTRTVPYLFVAVYSN